MFKPLYSIRFIILIMVIKRGTTTIAIKWNTYRRLEKLGRKGDSFDKIICKLLDKR